MSRKKHKNKINHHPSSKDMKPKKKLRLRPSKRGSSEEKHRKSKPHKISVLRTKTAKKKSPKRSTKSNQPKETKSKRKKSTEKKHHQSKKIHTKRHQKPNTHINTVNHAHIPKYCLQFTISLKAHKEKKLNLEPLKDHSFISQAKSVSKHNKGGNPMRIFYKKFDGIKQHNGDKVKGGVSFSAKASILSYHQKMEESVKALHGKDADLLKGCLD